MATDPEQEPIERTDPESSERPEIGAFETSPGTRIFIESGNADAWISTDLVVEPRC